METLYQMQAEKSEEVQYFLQVSAQQTTFGDNKYDDYRCELMAQRHIEQKIKKIHILSGEVDTRTDPQ